MCLFASLLLTISLIVTERSKGSPSYDLVNNWICSIPSGRICWPLKIVWSFSVVIYFSPLRFSFTASSLTPVYSNRVVFPFRCSEFRVPYKQVLFMRKKRYFQVQMTHKLKDFFSILRCPKIERLRKRWMSKKCQWLVVPQWFINDSTLQVLDHPRRLPNTLMDIPYAS